MLEDLGEFCRHQEEALLARLVAAETPLAAFSVACEYRALKKMIRGAEAAVSVGKAAASELFEEE